MLCGLAVKWGQRGLACDNCDKWYHVSCMSISSGEYDILANKSTVWSCIKCDSSNHTTLYNTLSASDNAFTSLNSISEDSITSPTATSFHIGTPLASSSPKTSTNKKTPTNINSLRTVVVNFQSIKNKAPEVQVFLSNTEPDIIIGTETWLHPGVQSSEVIPPVYNTYRNDRKSDCHGGVLIAIKSNLISMPVYSSKTSELLCVKIETTKNKSLLVSSLYRPPGMCDPSTNKATAEEITNLRLHHPNSQFWIGGDWNLPDIDWENLTVPGNQYPKEVSKIYLDLATNCSLEQIVTTPTRGNNILDIFLMSNPTFITKCKTIPGVGDHDIVIVDSKTIASRLKPPRRTIYLWDKANIEGLHDDASLFARDFLAKIFDNTIEMWDEFHQHLNSIQSKNVPSKQSRTGHTHPWINTNIRRLIRRRDRAYHKAKASKKDRDWKRYRTLKTEVKRNIRTAHNQYISNIISPDSKQTPKRFWSFIKSKRQESSGVAPLKYLTACCTAMQEV